MAEPATPAKDAAPPAHSKLKLIISVLLAGVAVPLAIIGFLFGGAAAGAAIFGIMVGLLNAMTSRKLALMAALLLVLLAPVAVTSGLSPVAAATLLGVVCMAIGMSAGWGLQRGLSMVPLTVAFLILTPPAVSGVPADRTSTSYLFAIMAVMAIAALCPIAVIALVLRGKPSSKPVPNSRADTVEYAVIITVLTSLSMFAVLALKPPGEPFWLILTLLVCVQVGPQTTIRRTFQRVGGTILGGILAALVVTFVASPAVLTVFGLGTLVMMIYYMGRPEYWLYTTFLTPTIVFFSGTSAAEADEARVIYTVTGGVLALIALAISHLLRSSGGSQTPVTGPIAA